MVHSNFWKAIYRDFLDLSLWSHQQSTSYSAKSVKYPMQLVCTLYFLVQVKHSDRNSLLFCCGREGVLKDWKGSDGIKVDGVVQVSLKLWVFLINNQGVEREPFSGMTETIFSVVIDS